MALNINKDHWRVVFIDILDLVFYYDDGLKLNLPTETDVLCKAVLNVTGKPLSSKWRSHRLGMPLQPPSSSSCGIGVLLTVKELLRHDRVPIPFPFGWTFGNDFIRNERVNLILEIVNM